jgi:outer membrane receptor protein involved in Fe transport
VDSWGAFSLAADFFSIELSDSVTRVGSANILSICYGSPNPATEPLCSLVSRDASNRLTVFDNYTNIASQEAEGWDYGVRYVHSLLEGEITLTANLVQYTSQMFQFLPTFAPTDTNGLIGSPEMAGDGAVNFSTGPWNFHYGVSWIDGMSDYAAQGEDPSNSFFFLSTPDYFLHNTSVQYTTDAWNLTLGVRNLLDEQPPIVSSANSLIKGLGATPLFSGFDYSGRQFFVNLSASF